MSGNRRATTLLSAIGLLLTVLLASCTPAIRVERLRPAPYNKAAKLTNITIAPFTGPGAAALKRDVDAIISSIKVDGTPFFSTTVEGRASYGSRSNRAGLPGTIGGYGLLNGAVTKSRCYVERYTEERAGCLESVKKGSGSECIRWEQYRVDCFKSTGEYGFELKLTDRENGELVYTLGSEGTIESSACNDLPTRRLGIKYRSNNLRCVKGQRGPMIAVAKKRALNKAQRRLKYDIAPHYVTETIRLMDSDEGIESEEAKIRLKRGIEFAKNLWLLKAQDEWKAADRLSPSNASITYNLGVSAEFYGRFEEAAALYKKAYALDPEPNEFIVRSIERVKGIITGNRRLAEQMKSR